MYDLIKVQSVFDTKIALDIEDCFKKLGSIPEGGDYAPHTAM